MESSLELSEEMRKAIFHRFNENKQEPRRVRQGEDEPNFEDPEFYKKFFERCVVRFQQDEMIEKGLFDAAWTRDISRLVTFARSGPDTIANTVNDTVNSSSSQGAQHNTVPTPGPSLPGFDEHSSGPGNKTKQRVKLGVSCDLCRQRKVKCDRERPKCLRCTTRGNDCTYPSAPVTENARSKSSLPFAQVFKASV